MFERMLVSREARRCALLWRCYLAAELHFGRPQAARRVFLRAIHECPGSQVRGCDARRPRAGRLSNWHCTLEASALACLGYRVCTVYTIYPI